MNVHSAIRSTVVSAMTSQLMDRCLFTTSSTGLWPNFIWLNAAYRDHAVGSPHRAQDRNQQFPTPFSLSLKVRNRCANQPVMDPFFIQMDNFRLPLSKTARLRLRDHCMLPVPGPRILLGLREDKTTCLTKNTSCFKKAVPTPTLCSTHANLAAQHSKLLLADLLRSVFVSAAPIECTYSLANATKFLPLRMLLAGLAEKTVKFGNPTSKRSVLNAASRLT